jgi:hypothetical protein
MSYAKPSQAEIERAAKKAPRKQLRKIRIHYVVAKEGGPIKSGAADIGLPLVNRDQMPREFAAACGAVVDGHMERGSGEPWAVHCDECEATAVFKENDRPRPGLRLSEEQRQADGKKECGGCG